MAVTVQIINNGDKVNWAVKVCNSLATSIAKNARLVLTIPNGVSLTGPSDEGSSVINVEKGIFDETINKWYLGDFAPGECVTQIFEITIDDVNLAISDIFTLTAALTGDCTEVTIEDNTDTLSIEIVDPCELVELTIIPTAATPDLELVEDCSSSQIPNSSGAPSSSIAVSSSVQVSSSIDASSSNTPSSSVGTSSSDTGSSSAVTSSSFNFSSNAMSSSNVQASSSVQISSSIMISSSADEPSSSIMISSSGAVSSSNVPVASSSRVISSSTSA